MRVCEVSAFGGPEVLRIAERPWPVAERGEVIVEVLATSVNPTDLAARAGAHRKRMPELTPPFVPGWDIAGVVADGGESGYATGDPVVGMIPWVQTGGRVGAYAAAAAVDAAWLAPRSAGFDPVSAATLPLNALTARQGLDLIAAPPGATILITGASGAVGGYAAQLAAADGLRVIAQASAGDEDWVASLGAADVVARDVDYARLGPVDALFDAVPVGAAAAVAVRDGGVALFTRGVTGVDPERIRVEARLAHPDSGMLSGLVELAQRGQLRTRVARTFDLAQAPEAHRLAERGGLRGKLVLTI
jgi:NADPH2:quinone reductase